MTSALLHDSLRVAASRWPRRVACRAGDVAVDFATLDDHSDALAVWLSRAGIGPGVRVAVLCANRPEFLVAVEAISKAGAAAVLISPAWKSLEIANALAVAGPVFAIADGGGVAELAALLGRDSVLDIDSPVYAEAITDAGVLVSTRLRIAAPSARPAESADHAGRAGFARDERIRVETNTGVLRTDLPEVTPDAAALLVFSSGTVGTPKAVRHTHSSIAHAVRHWRETLDLGPGDRFQVATPPSHILGLLNLLTAIDAGACVRLHRRFDLDEILHRIETEKMTLEMAVAPVALAMANHPDLEAYDLSSLRYIMWGATPVTPSVAETVTRRTGVRWLAAYGTSEVPVVAVNPVREPERWRLDSPGLPPPGVELRVADLVTGEVLPAGETGEIQVHSESAMAGYLPEEANDEVFVDGWYRTGDVGFLEPEGWVRLTDRSKELVKVSGFQVAPAEIEGVLLGHPDVIDCAVFGVADERTGERPVAAVRLADSATVTPEELRDLVARTLATYKQVRTVLVVDSIPRLPSGKALRRTLRAEWEPVLAGQAETGEA